jgi:hypothetical protein
MAVLWKTAPCNLREVDQHFKGAYCYHHQGNELVKFCETTQRSIPQDSHFHTRRRENMKSHIIISG